MTTPNEKTIRGASHYLGVGDFTTIQAWEDYADGQDHPHQWAKCYSGVNLGTFTISGWSSTPLASGYPRVFSAYSGSNGREYHFGNYNRGPYIYSSDTPATGINVISESYTRIDGLTSNRGFSIDLDSASHVSIDKCMALSYGSPGFKAGTSFSSVSSSGNIFSNCVSIGTTDSSDVGFDIGGENMTNGLPQVSCIHCTSYGHTTYGFKYTNTNTAGYSGGANIVSMNCLSMDNTGADYAYTEGGSGQINFRYNLSSDISSVGPRAEFYDEEPETDYGFNLFNEQSSSTIHNPSIDFDSAGFMTGDFRIKSASPALSTGSGLFTSPTMGLFKSIAPQLNQYMDASTVLSRDIRYDSSQRVFPSGYQPFTVSIGAYEYADISPTDTFTLKIQGSTGGETSINNYIPLFQSEGTTSNSMGVFSLYSQGHVVKTNTANLYSKGHAVKTNTAPLYTTNHIPSKSRTLYISGKPIITPPTEFVSTFVAPTNTDYFSSIPLFVGTPASRQINNAATLEITGTSPVFPNEFLHYRRAGVSSDDYIPSTKGRFLFTESEKETCASLVAKYTFDNDANDSIGSSNFTVNGFITYLDYLNLSGYYRTPAETASGTGSRYVKGIFNRKIGTHSVIFIGNTHLHKSHEESFSSRDGIAVSFWVNNLLDESAQVLDAYSAPSTYPDLDQSLEGLITKGKIVWDKDNNINNFDGDWGIFKTVSRNSEYDLLFYTNVLDEDRGSTVITEGVSLPKINTWYFVMFWIDSFNKKSYFKIREGNDIEGITERTFTGQSWETKTTASDESSGASQADSHSLCLGYNSENSKKLGETYGDVWSLDDLRIYKPSDTQTMCSRIAMEQHFDSLFASYLPGYLSNNKATLYISGYDDTGRF